jgi:hypothetical protein
MVVQNWLQLDGDAADAALDRSRLASARRDAVRKESRLIKGKKLEVFLAFSRAQAGLTMREMAGISAGESIVGRNLSLIFATGV